MNLEAVNTYEGNYVRYNYYVFPRGHGNEFSNLIGSLRGTRHGNTWGFVLWFTEPFKNKSLFQNGVLLDKKVEKQLSFQNIFLLQ